MSSFSLAVEAERYWTYDSFGKSALTDLVGAMLSLDMLPRDPELASWRVFEELSGRDWLDKSRPLRLKHPCGKEFLCDGRLLPGRLLTAEIVYESIFDSSVTVLVDGDRFVLRYRYVADANWYVKAVNASNDPLMEIVARMAAIREATAVGSFTHMKSLPDTVARRGFTRERVMLMNSSSGMLDIAQILYGFEPEKALCKWCNRVVSYPTHVTCPRRGVEVVALDSGLRRDAFLGDRLQEYHFVAIAMIMGDRDVLPEIGHLFSNASHRAFLMSRENAGVVRRYGLLPEHNDHTWGTVCEAEYQRDQLFRERYLNHICNSRCQMSVSLDTFERIAKVCIVPGFSGDDRYYTAG